MSLLLPLPRPICLALAMLLGACQSAVERVASDQLRTAHESLPSSCTALAQSFRDDVQNNGVANARAPALPIFELLHSNRFLSTLARSLESDQQTSEWTGLLADLATQVRESENRNLSAPWSEEALSDLTDCSRIFSSSPEFREERLAVANSVSQSDYPEHYSPRMQALGALPLLRPFLKQRILAEHATERSMFFAEETFTRSSLYRLAEDRRAEVHSGESMQAAYAENSLQLPLLTESELGILFREHAPSLHIELLDANDRIGEPRWQGDRVQIDTENPVVYTHASMTRFEERNLLQLNFVFWFPERKPRGLIDLYAGVIDSIIWRVTLDETGQVMFYDSIHSCGCYHKYFAVADGLFAKTQPGSKEPANILPFDRSISPGDLVLKMTANEHFIVAIESKDGETQGQVRQQDYRLAPYSLLENLEAAGGSRSLFDRRGLITGSERLERFTLWPTGILSVGAMRQWGTHATGFIQNQHFDDPNLFEYYFETLP